MLAGVPMHWMVRWPGPYPVFLERAQGANLYDVDGHVLLDLCLGDTGAMTGHVPEAVTSAVQSQGQRGYAAMLPSEDALWVSTELSRRFGLPFWQFALTATDANRFAIRLARHVTGRKRLLVFNRCYHGTVDETFFTLKDGLVVPREGCIGPLLDASQSTRVVEFNDVEALGRALADRDTACVLAEPVMTNVGIIQPEPGFHNALRQLTRDTGTLLILDETHTICAGPGGYTGAHGLSPDMVTVGKPIGGGVPAAAYGLSARLAAQLVSQTDEPTADTGGIGGTLSGNALSMAAMKAALSSVLTDEAYQTTIHLAEQWTAGVHAVIEEFDLPWHVNQLGCRAEYAFAARRPRNGGEAAAAVDLELDQYMHLGALNRGILMTPFHNMALISPQVKQSDVDTHTAVFRELVHNLTGDGPPQRECRYIPEMGFSS